MYDYNATLVRVIDGDTMILDFDLGLSTHRHASVRLAGIDAIERSEDPEGLAKKAMLDWFAATSNEVLVKTVKDRKSFDRYIATVMTKHLSKSNMGMHPNLSQYMVEQGFAVEKDYGIA